MDGPSETLTGFETPGQNENPRQRWIEQVGLMDSNKYHYTKLEIVPKSEMNNNKKNYRLAKLSEVSDNIDQIIDWSKTLPDYHRIDLGFYSAKVMKGPDLPWAFVQGSHYLE